MADKTVDLAAAIPVYTHISRATKDIRCPKCHGQVAVGSEMTRRLPVGFGFMPGDDRFSISAVEYSGWYGQCMKCGRNVFAWHSKKAKVTHPKGINRKLRQARKAGRAVARLTR